MLTIRPLCALNLHVFTCKTMYVDSRIYSAWHLNILEWKQNIIAI